MAVDRDRGWAHHAVCDIEPRIPASTIPTSTTATFLLSGLPGGHDYWFSPTVNVSDREGNRASVIGRHVSMVVDATPSG